MGIYTIDEYKIDMDDYDFEAAFKPEDLALFDITPIELSYYISCTWLSVGQAVGSMQHLGECFAQALLRLQNTLIEMRQKKEELSYISNENALCKKAVEKAVYHRFENQKSAYEKAVECILKIIESRERVELKNKTNH